MNLRTIASILTVALAATCVSACGGGGGATGGVFSPLPTATPSPVPTAAASLLCTTAGAPQSAGKVPEGLSRRVAARTAPVAYVPGVIEVVRGSNTPRSAHATQSVRLAGTSAMYDVVHVARGSEDATVAQLRSQPGVIAASRAVYVSMQRTNAALTNDPYVQGFGLAATPPLYESSTIPGQWDLHVICAANAWGYANTNTTGNTHPAAAGGTSAAPMAIIDTGADLTHPELSGRVTYAEIDVNGVTTAGPGTMHDNDGHGTNVAGIAGAAANNGVGFAGVAYNAPLQIYKVFPDPPSGGCAPGSSNSACEAASSDIALAINHAVAHGAKVINLSLGATTPDSGEQSAVEAAISAGVVVVAAAGNDGAATLDYPAGYAGVIAVGASTIDDSVPSSITEGVATYSDYDASNPASWGLVAPGGSASSGSDSDDLHWIENIYTSTASDSSADCTGDFDGGTVTDCRVLIAGTSQAAPHVTGAVSLLLSAGASASTMKSLLCSTANGLPVARGGCGRLNVYRAMAQVVGDPAP